MQPRQMLRLAACFTKVTIAGSLICKVSEIISWILVYSLVIMKMSGIYYYSILGM